MRHRSDLGSLIVVLAIAGSAFAWLFFRTPEVHRPSADIPPATTTVQARDVTFTEMIGMTVGDLYAKTGYNTDRKSRVTIVVVPMDSAARNVGVEDQVIAAACGTDFTVAGGTVWLAVYHRADIPPDVEEQMGRKSLVPREALISRVPQCPDIAQGLAY